MQAELAGILRPIAKASWFVFQANRLILQSKGSMAGLKGYDAVIDPLTATIKGDDMKSPLEAGQDFYEALDKMKNERRSAGKNPASPATSLLPLTKVIKKHPGTRYAEVAEKIIEELTKYPMASINPAMFFNAYAKK